MEDNKKDLKKFLGSLSVVVFGEALFQLIIFILIFFALYFINYGSEALEIESKINGLFNNNIFLSFYLLISNLVFLILIVLIFGRKNIIKDLKNKFNWKLLLYSLGAFGAIILSNYLFNTFVVEWFKLGISQNQENVTNTVIKLPIISFFSMCVIAPITEELVFRYGIFKAFKKNKVVSYILSSLLFMLAHGMAILFSLRGFGIDTLKQLVLLIPYGLAGLILAILYDKTKNLAAPIFAHSINNIISFILLLI